VELEPELLTRPLHALIVTQHDGCNAPHPFRPPHLDKPAQQLSAEPMALIGIIDEKVEFRFTQRRQSTQPAHGQNGAPAAGSVPSLHHQCHFSIKINAAQAAE
jgi:hypothetical protein